MKHVVEFPKPIALPAGAQLSNEIIKILAQFGLAPVGMIQFTDLQRSKIVNDYGHLRRLKSIGFPSGRWLSANRVVWTPEEIGTYLLQLPTERPKLPPSVQRKRPPAAQRAKTTKPAKAAKRVAKRGRR